MKGFIVYSTYISKDDRTVVQLFGKLENGESFVTQNTIEPYLFIEESEIKKVKKYLRDYKTEKTDLTTFQGEKVIKIIANNQAELNKLEKVIHKEVKTYEGDIKPHFRFLIDKNILGTMEIEGDYSSSEKINRIYEEPEISPATYKPKLKVVSLDIECSSDLEQLMCIGLTSEGYKKNFIISDKEVEGAISCVDEADCLEKFRDEIINIDPDIITGWNVIDFDFSYLQKRFNKHKIPFDLGRTNSPVRMKIQSNFFRSSSVKIPGRQVLDGLNLIKDPFIQQSPTMRYARFKSYTLDDVAQQIVGEGKLLKGKERHIEIEELYENNKKKLVEYNIQDCLLVQQILEKTQMVNLAIERSMLTGMQFDKLTASIAAFDSLYIRESRKKNLVSPTTIFRSREERIKGGYVSSLNPGIYHNVLIFDFKSIYPSIIKTFNIDPASFLEEKEKGAIETPNKAYFKNQEGILPEIIKKLHEAREKAKREKRELSNYAIKVIQNSFFGVLASPNCRYYNLAMANSITHFGQFILKLTAEEVEKRGYKVIYSDTDSIFLETNLEKEKANKLGKEIEGHINKFYEDYITKNYNRESYLELEFEKQYLSMVIPKTRGKSETAAKKRYAGLIEKDGKEEIQVTGLEAIRGDWTDAAREFQIELLKKLFHKEPVAQFIRDYIEKIKAGELDKKLVYRKSLRKDVSKYTKTTPPHVKAARLLDKVESSLIEYYLTTEGPEPIQKLKHKIDYDHYITKQIKPIAEQILSLLDKDFDEVVNKSKQAKLF